MEKGGLFLFHYRMFLTRHREGTDRRNQQQAEWGFSKVSEHSHIHSRSLHTDLLLSNQHTTTHVLMQEETSGY
jgi:hypothetical protein